MAHCIVAVWDYLHRRWTTAVGRLGELCSYSGDRNSPYDNYSNPLVSLSSSQPLITRDWTLIPATPATANTPAVHTYPGCPIARAGVPGAVPGVARCFGGTEHGDALDICISGGRGNQAPPNPPPPPSPGTALNIAEPPTDPIPLTTAMDYFNVVPDSNLDGVVQVPGTSAHFRMIQANRTQSRIGHAHDVLARLLLAMWAEPNCRSIAYLEQGAFGSSLSSEGTSRTPTHCGPTLTHGTAGSNFRI